MDHVLAVDDSHVIRRLVEVSLDELGVDVATAGSGAEAIEALDARTPDVLILDIGLPDVSGWEVLAHVREEPQLDGLPVVMLTGYGDADDHDRAKAGGVAGYLVKPFRPGDLRRAVKDVLRADRDPAPLGAPDNS